MSETSLIGSDAGRALLQRPAHALAMIAGVLLAVASATATVAIADTQQARIDLRFDLQRSHHVVVQADSLPDDGFPWAQVRRLVDLPAVASAGELSIWNHSARASRSIADADVTATVVVADDGGLSSAGAEVRSGLDSDLIDRTDGAALAWVGRDLASGLGVAPAAAGTAADADAQIIVNGIPLAVAGILSAPDSFSYVNGAVVVSRRAAITHLPGRGENVRLLARVRPGSAGVVGEHAARLLDPNRSFELRDVTPPDGVLLTSHVAGDLRRIGMALATVIGAVGMLTSANTLVMSVHQRRRELGLRSAIGWSRRRIGLLLLAESGLAGLLAGVLGTGVGLAAAVAWSEAQSWELVVDPRLPWLVVGGGFLASLIGGVVPALRAASTSPLAAMRS